MPATPCGRDLSGLNGLGRQGAGCSMVRWYFWPVPPVRQTAQAAIFLGSSFRTWLDGLLPDQIHLLGP